MIKGVVSKLLTLIPILGFLVAGITLIFSFPERQHREVNHHVVRVMFFQGQTMNPILSPLLAYPTELLLHAYSLPLIPNTILPFNLLFTMNALRLNLEYTKSQRGVERGYLQASHLF